MNISARGIELIKSFEGCRLKAYKCPAGVWTIGYGHTGHDVYMGLTIDQGTADALLKADLKRFENHVNSFNSRYFWTQNEFDSMVSFAFNIGSINQLTKNGTRSKKEIAEKIQLYCNANGKRLEGLVRRRNEEARMFTEKIGMIPEPTLKIRMKGDNVKYLQNLLNNRFGCFLEIDGSYGSKTKASVMKMQTIIFPNNPEEHDGVYGPKTYKRLMEYIENGN